MSLHLGVCASADAVTGVYVNEKVAWEGDSTEMGSVWIHQPELFGGIQKEGGLVGDILHLPGRPSQVIPEWMAQRFGKTALTMPGFRGFTSLFFSNGEALGGFVWSHNNPIIAQTIKVRARRHGPVLLEAHRKIGKDANGAHIVYECLTNTDWGLGDLPTTVDEASFNAAAAALVEEQFGLSLKWTRQTSIETFVTEVLDHIQATLYMSPATGKWTLRLMRDDYDIEQLPSLNETNAKLKTFKRVFWGEQANEVSVAYTNPANEQTATVTAQDLASVVSQQAAIQTSRNFHGVRSAELAMRLAEREVRMSTAPLASATVEVDRSAWSANPADVFRIDFPKKKVNGIVCRVVDIDYGKPTDKKIVISLLQDVFSLAKPPLAKPPTDEWVNPGKPPEPMTATEVITIPSYFAASADFQSAAVALEYPEVLAGVLAHQDNKDTPTYELLADDVDTTGEIGFQPQGSKHTLERTALVAAMPAGLEGRIQNATIADGARGPRVGGFVFLGGGSDANMEIAQVVSYDADEKEWVLARGVLDTVPRTWTPGTPVWFVNPGQQIIDDRTVRSAGEVVDYKLLSRTSRGLLPVDDAPVVTETLTARPHMPLRPANVKLNGQDFGDTTAGAAGSTINLSWATRNRLLEDGQVLRWDTGPVAPEYYQGTVVTVFDQGGAQVYRQWGLWTETELEMQTSWFARYSAIRIQVSARREDLELDSLQAFSRTITGLPADPNAPLPPTPPEPGPPPSPDPAPAEGAWTATGSDFKLDENGKVKSSIPAILVTGVRERSDAVGLVVRYKKQGTEDWFYVQEVALDDQPKRSSTTSVIASTTYVVEVAYRSARNILSHWRSLGPVTTGIVIAQQLEDLTADYVRGKLEETEQKIEVVLDRFDNINEIIDEFEQLPLEDLLKLREQVRQFGFDIGAAAEAIIERSLEAASLRAYVDALSYVDGVKVKSALVENITKTDDLVEVMTALIVRDGDASSSLVRSDKVKTGEGMTLAQSLLAMQSTIGENSAAITQNYLTLVSADFALALAQTQMQTNFGDFQASVAATYSTKADVSSALSSLDTTLRSYTQSYVATATQSFVTQSGLNSSISSLDTTLKAWVNNPSQNALAATVSQRSTALATLEGQLYSRHVMEANSNGAIARMTLLSAFGPITTSDIVFEGDNFFIRSGSNPKLKPFYYDTTNSTLYTENLVVRSAAIENLSVTEIKIANGGVSNAVAYYGSAGSLSFETQIVSGTINVTNGRVKVQVSPQIVNSNVNDGTVRIRLYRGGAYIKQWSYFIRNRMEDCRTLVFNDLGPGSGNIGYSATAWVIGVGESGLSSVSCVECLLDLENFKK